MSASTSTTNFPTSTFYSRYYPLGVVALVMLLYLPSMQGEFLFDDIYEIEQNPHIRTLSPLTVPMFSINTLPVRPLPYLTFALNYAAHQLNTSGYHLVNVILHLITGWLLFCVIYNSLTAPWSKVKNYIVARESLYLSLATSLLWLIHPLQTQAVSYIYQRIEIMVCLMMLFSLYAFQQHMHRPKTFSWLYISLMACNLGILSKESAFIIPFLILSYDWLLVERTPPAEQNSLVNWRTWYYPSLAGLWILQFVVINIQSASYGEFSGTSHDRWYYLLTQSWVLLHYLKLVFLPFPLVLDYHWWPCTSLSASLPASVICLTGVLITFWSIYKRYAWSFPLVWFFLTLAPSSSFVPVIAICAEHRMYLTLAAPLFVGLLFIFLTLRTFKLHYAAYLLLTLSLVIYFSVQTFQRNKIYQNRLSIWEDVRKKVPDNPNCYWYLGKTYTRLGNIPAAISSYETGLTKHIIVPGNRAALYSKFHNELGLLFSKNQSTFLLAQQHYQQALATNPANVEAHNNLGILYYKCGLFQQAVAQFELALQKRPDFPQAQQNLIIIQQELQQNINSLK